MDRIKINHSLLAAALSLVTTVFAASGANIPITSLPFNITAQGTYVLKADLNYLAVSNIPAIVIANNISGTVLVDLRGFTITGGGETSQNNVSLGISIGYYNADATNAYPIIIMNGALANFTVGIDASQGGRALLTNIVLNKLSITHPTGAFVQTTGVSLSATSSTVSHCYVSGYEFGITLDGIGGENNSYTDNVFTLVNSPFFVGNISSNVPVVIKVPVLIPN